MNTIYASRLLLNRQKIFNPLEIYDALASYFAADKTTEKTDFLYRLEWYKIGVVVPMLMYSNKMPEMRRFPECQLLETRLLPKLQQQNETSFQLFAVPDLKKGWDTTDESALTKWLQRQLKGAAQLTDVRFGPNNCIYYQQDGQENQQQTVTFKGILKIENISKLDALRHKPLGLAAELGCGLLYLPEEKELEAC